MSLTVAVAGAALAAWAAMLVVAVRAAFVVLKRIQAPSTADVQGTAEGLHGVKLALVEFEHRVTAVERTLQEEVDRARKDYARARAAESRARALTEEDEGDEPEPWAGGQGQGVLPLDAAGGQGGGMLPMREGMAGVSHDPRGLGLLNFLLTPPGARGI